MIAPLGRCYWAVAPYAPDPPFEIYGEGSEREGLVSVPTAKQFSEVAKTGPSEFKVVTTVKVRPVLVVSSVLEPFEQVLAVRLVRLERLSESTRQEVRDYENDRLFYLNPASFAGLPTENAAIATTMFKLPYGALDTSIELGALNENELRVLHERMARAHDFRLDMQVLEKSKDLMARKRAD